MFIVAQALVAEKGGGSSYAIGSLIIELGAFETNVAEFDAARLGVWGGCFATALLDATSTTGAQIKTMVARLNHDDPGLVQTAGEAMQLEAPDSRDNTIAQGGGAPASSGPAGASRSRAPASSFTTAIPKLIAPCVEDSINLGTRSLALVGSPDQAAINQLLADIRAYAVRANSFVHAQGGIATASLTSEMIGNGNAGTIAGLLGHALQIGDKSLVESAAAALADNAADVAANNMAWGDSVCHDGLLAAAALAGAAAAIQLAAPANSALQTAAGAEPAEILATGHCATTPPETGLASFEPALAGKSVVGFHGSASSLASTLADIVARLTTLHPAGSDRDAAGSNAETGSTGDSQAQANAGAPAASDGFAFHRGGSATNVSHEATVAGASIEPGPSATTDQVEAIIGFNKAAGDKIKIEGAVGLTSVTHVVREGHHHHSLITLAFNTGQAGGKPTIETIKIYGDPISKADIVLVQPGASAAAIGLDHDDLPPDQGYLALFEDSAGQGLVEPRHPAAQAAARAEFGDLPHLALG
jgi:hypothetical protein